MEHAKDLPAEADPIRAARIALYAAGGIELDRGRMVPTAPEFQQRADAYNALAAIHAKTMERLAA